MNNSCCVRCGALVYANMRDVCLACRGQQERDRELAKMIAQELAKTGGGRG